MKKIDINLFGMSSALVAIVITCVIGITVDIRWFNASNIFIYCLKLMVVSMAAFATTQLVVFNFGNFVRSAYFKIRGYSFFPIAIFPFCINFEDGKLKIRFTLRISVMFYDYLPKKIKESKSVDERIDIIKNGIYAKCFGRWFMLIVSAVICIIVKPIYTIVVLALCIEMLIFSNIYDRKYHGERIKIKNIKDRKGLLYFWGLTDIPHSELLDLIDLNEIVALFSVPENRNYILSGIKRILVENILNPTDKFPEVVNEIMQMVMETPEKISLDIEKKELDSIILYMDYALLVKDVILTNEVVYVFKRLQYEWKNSSLWWNYFQWYLEVIEFSRGQINSFSVKEKPMVLVRTDGIGFMPGRYCTDLRKAESFVNDLILKR